MLAVLLLIGNHAKIVKGQAVRNDSDTGEGLSDYICDRSQKARDYSGLTGSIALTRFSVGFNDSLHTARFGYSLGAGIRCVLPGGRVSLGIGGALAITDVGGLDSRSHRYSFSRMDVSITATYTVFQHGLRIFVATTPLKRWAVRTSERHGADETVLANFRDGGTQRPLTFGLELPIRRRRSGLLISFTSLSGTFSRREHLGDSSSVKMTYSGSQITVGWSGPIGTVDLPWR